MIASMITYPKPYKYLEHIHYYTYDRRYVESTIRYNVKSVYVKSGNGVVSYPMLRPVMRLGVGPLPELDLVAYVRSRIVWLDGERDLAVKRILDEAKDSLGLLALSYVS